MSSLLSDKINTGIKKKKKRKSPLSERYTKFMNHQNIKLHPTTSDKDKPIKLDEIKINVIKSPEIHKIGKKKPCKRRRVIKNGIIDEKALQENKKCEEEEKKKKVEEEEKKKKVEETVEEIVKEIFKGKKIKSKKKKKKKSMRKKKTLKRKKTVKNAKKEMEKANEMSDEFIKQELLKSGIEIKGNQKQLMRDIYVFSNLGGIKVRKE